MKKRSLSCCYFFDEVIKTPVMMSAVKVIFGMLNKSATGKPAQTLKSAAIGGCK